MGSKSRTASRQSIYQSHLSNAMRRKKEILAEAVIAESKVWYDRHQVGMESVYPKEQDPKVLGFINGAIKSARNMERKYGKKNLGPYTKFEWGMLNGRLETLRWVLGEDWGNLDS